MAKESGITMTVNVDDSGGTARDLSNEISSLDFATPRNVQVVTGVGQSAEERLLLLADLTATLNGRAFNDAANNSHDVFKNVGTTSVQRTLSIAISGQTLADEVWLTDYALSRGDDGSITYTVPAVLADGSLTGWA